MEDTILFENSILFFDKLTKVVQYALSHFKILLPKLLDSLVIVLGFALIVFVMSMVMWAFWIVAQIFISLIRGFVRIVWSSYGRGLDKSLGEVKRRTDQIGRD